MYQSSFNVNRVEGMKVNPKILLLAVRYQEQPEGYTIMWLLINRQEQS